MGRGCGHANRFFLVWGFNGPRISQSRVHFCWHHRNSSMDGFPMTWNRNIALFDWEKICIPHIVSIISWLITPPPSYHITKFRHDLMYAIVAVFQWPEREVTLFLWENLYFTNPALYDQCYHHHGLTLQSSRYGTCNCYQVTFLTSSPRKFEKWSYSCYMSLIKTIHVITTLHCTGPMLIDFTNCSWPIWRSTEEYICINYA